MRSVKSNNASNDPKLLFMSPKKSQLVWFSLSSNFKGNQHLTPGYEGGSESFVIGVITLLIDIIGCCIMP